MAKPIMLVSMELDDEDKAVETAPMTREVPDFPWGLRLCLTDKELRKLKLDASEAFVGGTIHGHFLAEITSVSSNQVNGDECFRLELQIREMAIESEDEEDAAPEAAPAPKRKGLYRA
jgi:hypothetical protein